MRSPLGGRQLLRLGAIRLYIARDMRPRCDTTPCSILDLGVVSEIPDFQLLIPRKRNRGVRGAVPWPSDLAKY